MRKTTTLLLAFISAGALSAVAQPVITSSITTYPVGSVDSAYGASASVLPGSGGAGVTWDMSTVATVFAAKLTVAVPATTPYASTFGPATYAVKIESSTTSYNYNIQSSKGIENLAIQYAGTGTGTDFSPNPRLSVPFPFSFNDSKSDTFQSTTSGNDTVRLTYDGYGTLKTPFYNYPNVIRIKEDYGTSYSYSWYTVSPFALVMNYSSSSNNYVIVTTPVGSTGVRSNPSTAQAGIYPNPTSGDAVLTTNLSPVEYGNALITLTDVSGRIARQIPVTSSHTTLPASTLAPGLYLFSLQSGTDIVARGKLVVQ